MKMYYKFLLAVITIAFVLAMSACSEEAIVLESDLTGESSNVIYETLTPSTVTMPTDLAKTEQLEKEKGDDYFLGGVGDPFWHMCHLHSMYFCGFAFANPFVNLGIIDPYDFFRWSMPLLEKMQDSSHDECLVNIVAMIEHFGITREVFQQVIIDYSLERRWHFNLDVIYSGDWNLINQYYDVQNEFAQFQMVMEREQEYFTGRINAVQARAIAYSSEVSGRSLGNNHVMSRYFHDIATFIGLSGSADWFYITWVRHRSYDQINIVEFANHFYGDNRDVFAYWVTELGMNLYTHYNLDIIFSDDWDLILEYYAIENQAYHSALVQAARDGYGPTHRLSFNLGANADSPPTPAYIRAVNVPEGIALLNFIASHHYPFPEQDPTRQGYRFMGWYLDANFTVQVTDTFRMPARDATLYARWRVH